MTMSILPVCPAPRYLGLVVAWLIGTPLSAPAQLPKPADFPVGSPERLWVTEIQLWAAGNWTGIIKLQRAEWHKLYPGGKDETDPDDPMWAVNGGYKWGTPVAFGPISREQLSAGIVRLTAPLTVKTKKGVLDKRVYRCKIYPKQTGGWELDMNHCSMLKAQ